MTQASTETPLHKSYKSSQGLVTTQLVASNSLSFSPFFCRYNHRNILSLVAYSNDGPVPCLVYEYMKHGSLAECLVAKVTTNYTVYHTATIKTLLLYILLNSAISLCCLTERYCSTMVSSVGYSQADSRRFALPTHSQQADLPGSW